LGRSGDTGIRFYGSLDGYGATWVAGAIRLAAGVDEALTPALRIRLGELVEPVHLRLYALPEHDETPPLVRAACALAVGCPHIWLDVIHAYDFASDVPLAASPEITVMSVDSGRLIEPSPDEADLVRQVLVATARMPT
ncbi:MAG TPA: hypothetical protein VHF22_09505, partial [Planctomycetota bacterium]|nr:hypothetical protein [Planctomycetota bacterium]